VPTNFTVVGTPATTFSATLSWSPPTTGGAPATYEIYRSTTAGEAFQPANHLTSIPVVAGQASYTFIDNTGLTPVNTYWVVSAKNAAGESPTAEVMYAPIEPPGVPTNLSVVRTPETTLSATVIWSPPTTGGDPATFEIYRSTTAGEAFLPDNHLTSIPVVAGQASYTFIDNAGLTPVDTYWVISAKNAGGETPTDEVMYKPIGPPGGTGDTGYGNNFAAALIFADDIGLGGDPITGTWTTDAALIDYSTGLRPLTTELAALAARPLDPVVVTTLPYLDPQTVYPLDGVDYYKQQTASIWQGPWEKGAGTLQEVDAKWGDNLISQNLTQTSVVRIEMVLSKTLTTAVQSYTMHSLYGSKRNEIYGTDGTTYANSTAFVFASNARLKIEKLDVDGSTVVHEAYNQTLWEGDGPGFLGAEVNVAGNFTYGFVWNMKNEVMPGGIPKTGTWRITFSLDDPSPKGTPDNTNIVSAANGTLVDENTVYIDIVIH